MVSLNFSRSDQALHNPLRSDLTLITPLSTQILWTLWPPIRASAAPSTLSLQGLCTCSSSAWIQLLMLSRWPIPSSFMSLLTGLLLERPSLTWLPPSSSHLLSSDCLHNILLPHSLFYYFILFCFIFTNSVISFRYGNRLLLVGYTCFIGWKLANH